MIGKYLDLCTSHLTCETVDNLVMENIPYIPTYVYEEGMFIIIPDNKYIPKEIKYPEDLMRLFDYAKSKECYVIRLDRDAEELNDLMTYEW